MSDSHNWFHPSTPAGSTRLCMAGAFAGALIVLASSAIAGWPITHDLAGQAADPATVAANVTVGDCLTWSNADANDLRAVTCSAAHLFEVTGTTDLAASYPAGASFPDVATWQTITQHNCTSGATSYLVKLDPAGKYVVGALKPTSAQWASGNRTLRCGLEIATSTGLVASTGSARGADQSNVYQSGTCLALLHGASGGPVPCTTAHAYEIVGTVNLHDQFPNGYPAVTDQQTALAKACAQLESNYTGGANLSTYNLKLGWDTIAPPGWNAGSYQVNCKVGAVAADGSGLAPVSNSIRDIGASAPQPAVAAPPTSATTPGG